MEGVSDSSHLSGHEGQVLGHCSVNPYETAEGNRG